MTPLCTRRAGPGILALFLLAACSSTKPPSTSPAPEPARSSAEIRADSLRHPYTQADVDFMTHMISHHAQALVMAGWAPSHGASGSVRTLSARIINAQQDEIASMQRWLRDRGKPAPEPGSTGMKMSMGHGQHEMLMPGMLTEAQMRQLDQARGPEFDRLFLRFMIQHHRGAVSMVTSLFGTTGAARDEAVFKFANDVSVDQTTEVARMERMLAALPPG